ncbi:MAG TPA: hypothetical protein VI731_03405 [Bacteroidia bacterium]|nr:hypothetical protein [Bacteroidia bacterium]
MKKYKVNTDRPKPASSEILSGKNFEALLQKYNAAPGKIVYKPFWKKSWFIGSGFAAVAALAVTAILIIDKTETIPAESKLPQIVQQANTRTPEQIVAAPLKRQIAPPLSGLNVTYSSYKVKASKGGIVTHSSGSKLYFKPNAFVDPLGNVVTGNVDIHYREFRNPVDIFLSGIPMEYDSAGTTYHLESAGMLELTAFADGKTIYLDPTKPVEVKLASSGKETFNVYEFDTAGGKWVYRGTDKVVQIEQPPVLTDSISGKDRSGVAYIYRGAEWSWEYASFSDLPAEPIKPRKADKLKNRFKVDFIPAEFPELSVYSKAVFEVDEKNNKFDTTAAYHTTWESMTLSKGETEGRYVVTFKKGLTKLKAEVYPVMEGANYESAMDIYNRQYEEYQAAFAQHKKAKEAARLNYEAKVAENEILSEERLKNQANNSTFNEVMRVFTVNRFGIYNCDTPERLPVGGIVKLSCKNHDGGLLTGFSTMYHVDRHRFSLFSYHNSNPVSDFHFNPKSSNLIWAVRDGKLFMADNDQFTKMPVKGKGSIVLKPVEKTFQSAEEMREFFNIPLII